jgi:succinate dehydrogenase / fumarate reductase membrane anchor subunit
MTMTLRSPIGRARGLGSAKNGLSHHWGIIVTSVGLIPLSLWFVVSVKGLAGMDYAAFKAWMGHGPHAALMIVTVLLTVYHAVLGLSMVIEDYVACEAKKVAGLIATKLIGAFLAVAMTVSILKVAVGG